MGNKKLNLKYIKKINILFIILIIVLLFGLIIYLNYNNLENFGLDNKNYDNVFILFHLSTGDNFTMYALVRHYQEIYKKVNIFCLYRNRFFVKQLYEKFSNINIIYIDSDYNSHMVPNEYLEKSINNISNYDIVKTGNHNPIFKKYPYFWRNFYTNIDIPYEIRYKYNDINRNKENEENLYKSLIKKYSKNYIFVHDHRNVSYKHYDIRKNVEIDRNNEIPIFHPNWNYYNNIPHQFKNLWSSDLLSDNLLDYCTIIENAQEIHISDSAFSCLCPYLKLDSVKIKNIYTKYDLKDYHKSYNDWNIIKI